MNSQQVLIGAALTLLCAAGFAQTTTEQPSPGAAGTVQQAPTAPTDKMSGQTQAAALGNSANAATEAHTDKMSGQTATSNAANKAAIKAADSTKTAAAKSKHSASKRSYGSAGAAEQTAMQDQQAYRNALRQCVREPDDTMRGSCLDNAIEQFGRNS